MPFHLESEELISRISQAASGNDALHALVGHYFVAFGRAEHQLTRNLAHVLEFQDFEKFALLANEIPLQAKSKNLKKAAKDKSILGKNIEKRNNHFDNICRIMRNDLAHNDLELANSSIYLKGVGATVHGMPDNVRPTGGKVKAFHVDDIRRQILWLDDFAADLNECAERTWQGETLEVAKPKSTLP